MKKAIYIPVAVLFACIQTTGFARIGETKAECEARYGAPVQTDGDVVKYEKEPFIVMIQFDGTGIAEGVILASENAMTKEQVETLVTNNFMGQPVIPLGNNMWYTPDKSIRAVYDGGNTLNIFTEAYQNRLEQQQKEQLQGF